MPDMRVIVLLATRILFVKLTIVLMILWIVWGVQTVNEVKQLETKNRNDRTQITYDKGTLNRIKAITILNTIIEESIALLAIIGMLLSHRYVLHTAILLLAIIWLSAQMRITDYLWIGSPVMIVAHVIHFLVVLYGLVFVYFITESKNSKEKVSTKVSDTSIPTTKTA